MVPTFAEKAIRFYLNLEKPIDLPDKIEVVDHYSDSEVKETANKFYKKFFNDNEKRFFIFGINPGRFGGGITGINFTDPVALREHCGIENSFGNKRELSSQFVYKFINILGGSEIFYKKFFISAIYPLAILMDGKNYNFYEDKKVYSNLRLSIISYLKEQIEFGARDELVISLGKKNFTYLKELNDEIKFFKKIEFLEHPRFIMQYKRKQLEYFITKYVKLLDSVDLN
jgi:Uracil DNA glycosylase superfamily